MGKEPLSEGYSTSLPTRVLRPRRIKTLALFLVCVAFVAVGVLLILDEGSFWGYAASGFFGIGVVVFAVQLLPGSSYLEVGPEGFTMCSVFRARITPWSAVESFEVGRLGGATPGSPRTVVFNYSSDYAEHEMARNLASSMSGHEGALPDTYGMAPQELADLLNRYREHYTEASKLRAKGHTAARR